MLNFKIRSMQTCNLFIILFNQNFMTKNSKRALAKAFLIAGSMLLSNCSQDEMLETNSKDLTLSSKSLSSVLINVHPANISASRSDLNYPVTNIIDGNTTSEGRWTSKGIGVELIIDFEKHYKIDYVNIDFSGGQTRVYSFKVFTSFDKLSWLPVGNKKSSGLSAEFEEFDLKDSNARYVKFVFEGNNVTDTNNVSEIEIYGTELPNEDFNPIQVNFQDLKVETSYISKVKSEREEFLAREVDDTEWMDISEEGIVSMKCLAEHGQRTELKETQGVESSLHTYKRMQYKGVLNNIPSHGVTIAQIHTRGEGTVRPWIRVYVDYDHYIKVKETDTTPNQETSTYTTYPIEQLPVKYVEGDTMNITIETFGGVAYFIIESNGAWYRLALTPNEDWNPYANFYYLKAGVYTEGEDVEPQMNFSYFSIKYEK